VNENDPLKKLNTYLTELRKIDEEVKQVSVPLSYAAELYALRIHIAHVQRRIVEYSQNNLAEVQSNQNR